MNPTTDDHIPRFTDPAQEREWLVQEQATRRERLQLDPAADDVRAQRYRLLARVLREPQTDGLPIDFAQQMANQVAGTSAKSIDMRFERVLTVSLGITMLLVAVVVSVLYGGDWLTAIRTSLPALPPDAYRWLLTFGACVGMSWVFGVWDQTRTR